MNQHEGWYYIIPTYKNQNSQIELLLQFWKIKLAVNFVFKL